MEVVSWQDGLAWQRADICGVMEVDGHSATDELGDKGVEQ